jgi:hypothetical protein
LKEQSIKHVSKRAAACGKAAVSAQLFHAVTTIIIIADDEAKLKQQ